MATAEELLTQAAESGVTPTETRSYFTVDLRSRTISIPSDVKNIGVESDDEVTRLYFKVPRFYDDVDLSEFIVRINYTNANGHGDLYEVDDLTINDDDLIFSWLVGRFAVTKQGTVSFIVCMKKFGNFGITDKEFNTTICSLPVLKGLETVKEVVEEDRDALHAVAKEAAEEALENIDSVAQEAAETAIDEMGLGYAVITRQILNVKLGSEILITEPSLSTGWSGSLTAGFTHESGYDAELEFNCEGLVTIGKDYILEFDSSYISDEFLSVGFGNSYKILVYNGTGHITIPLRAVDSAVLYWKPYKNRSFTISNISLKEISEYGTEKNLEVYSTVSSSNNDNYGFWNVILGDGVMPKAVGSTRCIAIGNYALSELQGGHRNIGIGAFAMSQMTGGEMNISIGADSMFTVKEANGCIAIGKGSMHSGTKLTHNIAIGAGALNGGTDSVAELNIALGYNAGSACKGDRNIFMGYNTGMELSRGVANVYIGDQCTAANGKNQNVIIGASAKASGSANRSIAIGYQAETNKENQAVIGGNNIVETMLKGDLIVRGTDGVKRQIVFNSDGTCSWTAVS